MFALAVVLPAFLAFVTPGQAGGLQQGGWEHVMPIDLPPAPRGMAPQLSLVADHLAQDTVVGDGWRLAGLSKIERVSETEGVSRFDGLDRFRLDGMMLVEDPDAATTGCEYRTEQDSLQCFSYNNDGPLAANTWTARRDGWTWTWGEAQLASGETARRADYRA